MPVNPIDLDTPFAVDLRHPNPKFRQLESGPKYMIEFEVDQDTWNNFVDSYTKGMVLEADMRVTQRNYQDDLMLNLKGGKLSRIAGMMSGDEEAQEFAASHGSLPIMEEGDTDFVKALIYTTCGITSRKQLDDGPEHQVAAEWFARLRTEYLQWRTKDEH